MDYDQVRRNIYNAFLFQKCIVGAFTLGFGFLIALGGIVGQSFSAGLLIFGALLFVFGLRCIKGISQNEKEQVARFATLEEKNFDWYRNSFPENVQSGRVSCRNCGSRRINIRGLGDRTYHCEHKCAGCGQTLYYSPEGNL